MKVTICLYTRQEPYWDSVEFNSAQNISIHSKFATGKQIVVKLEIEECVDTELIQNGL